MHHSKVDRMTSKWAKINRKHENLIYTFHKKLRDGKISELHCKEMCIKHAEQIVGDGYGVSNFVRELYGSYFQGRD